MINTTNTFISLIPIYIFQTLMSSFITTPNSLTNHVQIMFWHILKQRGFYAYSLLLLLFFLIYEWMFLSIFEIHHILYYDLPSKEKRRTYPLNCSNFIFFCYFNIFIFFCYFKMQHNQTTYKKKKNTLIQTRKTKLSSILVTKLLRFVSC